MQLQFKRNQAFPGQKRVAPSKLSRRPLQVTNAIPLKVMISGAPAAGKGTQCEKIVDRYDLVHISVGDILREEVKNNTSAGTKAKDFMDKGLLVPDDVVVEMVKGRLSMKDCEQKGWLLDGYPRSASQAEAIEKEGIRPDIFLLIDVPDSMLIERVVGRRQDPVSGEIFHMKFKPPPKEVEGRLIQRSDDTEEKAATRLKTYNDNVNSVLGFYTGVLKKIDGTQSIDHVFRDIMKVLDEKMASMDPMEGYCADVPDADECRVYTD